MPTFLHLSDLHRTLAPRLSNDELLSAIVSDSTRWATEGIPRPDLILVSGDLIQGGGVDIPNSDSEIAAQYREAGDLLRRLAAEFTGSDRSRVIIVPGNHDVHWRRAFSAMQPFDTCPSGIATIAFEATSRARWNWQDRQAYEIVDRDSYNSRLQHFRQFQRDFYAEIDPSPLSDGDLVFVDYPDLELVVAGFSSWHGNDCFCHVGEIDPSMLALSRTLLARSQAPIAVAVWHHSIVGGPRAHDYMDQRIIHRLIDFGFSIGLHGHQHHAGAAPYELRLPNRTAMAVIGAGSLAVGDSDLPMGERRQFNVVVIDPDGASVTVHVRAMSPAGVFAGSHRDDFGGKTFMTLGLPRSPVRPRRPTATQLLDEAMTAVTVGQYKRTLELLTKIDDTRSHEKRRIEIRALEGLERREQLVELLDPPLSVEEAVKVISTLLDARRFDEASARLDASSKLVTPDLFDELATRIAAGRTIHGVN